MLLTALHLLRVVRERERERERDQTSKKAAILKQVVTDLIFSCVLTVALSGSYAVAVRTFHSEKAPWKFLWEVFTLL
jgi:hypothetical protein